MRHIADAENSASPGRNEVSSKSAKLRRTETEIGRKDPLSCSTAMFQKRDFDPTISTARGPAADGLGAEAFARRWLAADLLGTAGPLVANLETGIGRLAQLDDNCGQIGVIKEIQDLIRTIDREIRSIAS